MASKPAHPRIDLQMQADADLVLNRALAQRSNSIQIKEHRSQIVLDYVKPDAAGRLQTDDRVAKLRLAAVRSLLRIKATPRTVGSRYFESTSAFNCAVSVSVRLYDPPSSGRTGTTCVRSTLKL